jgi:hypothetical protein
MRTNFGRNLLSWMQIPLLLIGIPIGILFLWLILPIGAILFKIQDGKPMKDTWKEFIEERKRFWNPTPPDPDFEE